MKLPKKLKVGNYYYTVREVDDPQLDGEYVDGYHDGDKEIIVIRKNTKTVTQRRVSLLHELIHAISKIFGLGITEHQTYVLSELLIAIEIENKIKL
jgi:hypothetical protein